MKKFNPRCMTTDTQMAINNRNQLMPCCYIDTPFLVEDPTIKKLLSVSNISEHKSIKEISNEMSDQLSVAKHNIDEEPNTPTKYGVRGIPTMILMKDGNHVSTKVGAVPKSEIVSWIKENI